MISKSCYKLFFIILILMLAICQLSAGDEQVEGKARKSEWPVIIDVEISPNKKTFSIGEKISIIFTAELNEDHYTYFPEDEYIIQSNLFTYNEAEIKTTSINVIEGDLNEKGRLSFTNAKSVKVELSTEIVYDIYNGYIVTMFSAFRYGESLKNKFSGRKGKSSRHLLQHSLFISQDDQIHNKKNSLSFKYPPVSPEAMKKFNEKRKVIIPSKWKIEDDNIRKNDSGNRDNRDNRDITVHGMFKFQESVKKSAIEDMKPAFGRVKIYDLDNIQNGPVAEAYISNGHFSFSVDITNVGILFEPCYETGGTKRIQMIGEGQTSSGDAVLTNKNFWIEIPNYAYEMQSSYYHYYFRLEQTHLQDIYRDDVEYAIYMKNLDMCGALNVLLTGKRVEDFSTSSLGNSSIETIYVFSDVGSTEHFENHCQDANGNVTRATSCFNKRRLDTTGNGTADKPLIYIAGYKDGAPNQWNVDQWDNSVIAHEFAHNIQSQFGNLNTIDWVQEDFDEGSSLNAAFCEAFAYWLSSLVRAHNDGETYYCDEHEPQYFINLAYTVISEFTFDDSLEAASYDIEDDFSPTPPFGGNCTAAISYFLWDVYDTHNYIAGDNYSDITDPYDLITLGYAPIWNIVKNSSTSDGPCTLLEFRQKWQTTYTSGVNFWNTAMNLLYTEEHGLDGWMDKRNDFSMSPQIHKSVLNQNYPNPFNPITTISYSLKDKPKNATIKIYNIKGQKVNTIKLSDTEQHGSVIWDGKNSMKNDVSSGIYLYQLINDDKMIETKKMIMLK